MLVGVIKLKSNCCCLSTDQSIGIQRRQINKGQALFVFDHSGKRCLLKHDLSLEFKSYLVEPSGSDKKHCNFLRIMSNMT